MGAMHASLPPTSTTSARPLRIMSRPTLTDSAPDAHALTGVWMPALAPMSRPTQAAPPLGMSIGTDMGETRDQPRVLRISSCSSSDTMPPMPLADDDAEPLGVDLGPARVGPRLACRDEGELLVAVELARLGTLEHVGRLDGHLAGEAHGQVGVPLGVERPDAGASREQAVPGAGDVTPDGGGGTQSGDDDAPLAGHGSAPCSSAVEVVDPSCGGAEVRRRSPVPGRRRTSRSIRRRPWPSRCRTPRRRRS